MFHMMLVGCQSQPPLKVPQAETKKTKDEDAKVAEILDNWHQFQQRENKGRRCCFVLGAELSGQCHLIQ